MRLHNRNLQQIYVKPVNKDNRYVPGKVHKEIEYPSSDDTEDDSDKEEESTSNSEVKEEVYGEDGSNECDSYKKIGNQIDIEKKRQSRTRYICQQCWKCRKWSRKWLSPPRYTTSSQNSMQLLQILM